MASKNLWLPALIISLGIIIGCYFISLKPFHSETSKLPEQSSILINLDDASKLLGLSTDEIKKIISTEREALQADGSFEGTMFPYIRVDGELYFEKSELLVWAKANALNHRIYNNGAIIQ